MNNIIAIVELYPCNTAECTNSLCRIIYIPYINPTNAVIIPITVDILNGFTENAVNPFIHKFNIFLNVKFVLPDILSLFLEKLLQPS